MTNPHPMDSVPMPEPEMLIDIRQPFKIHSMRQIRADRISAYEIGRNAAHVSRGVLLFNPYTGTPRHPSDIQSDPHGILIHEPGEPLKA